MSLTFTMDLYPYLQGPRVIWNLVRTLHYVKNLVVYPQSLAERFLILVVFPFSFFVFSRAVLITSSYYCRLIFNSDVKPFSLSGAQRLIWWTILRLLYWTPSIATLWYCQQHYAQVLFTTSWSIFYLLKQANIIAINRSFFDDSAD